MAIPRNQIEVLALDKFRPSVKDLNFEDGLLMRFLRARDLDQSKAEDMLRKYVEWRMNMCNKCLGWTAPQDLYNTEIYLTGFDDEDRAVFWLPYGNWPSFRDIIDDGMADDIFTWSGKFLEKVHQLLLSTKHQQYVAILDCDGITFSKMFHELNNLTGFKTVINILQDLDRNYPELLHKAIIINAPTAFLWGWKLVSPFLSTNTCNKVVIYGSGYWAQKQWKTEIYANIPLRAIPTQYGGHSQLTGANEDFIPIWKKHCCEDNANCIQNQDTISS